MSGIVTFGEFELDQPRFELRIRGQPVDVQPKVLRLLILLVTERHRCVADDELLAAVWPRETVSRASIKRAVMGARTALRDRGQGCIRTVRGHGYQFVMPVETDAARGPASSTKNATVSVPLLASTTSEPSFVGREPELAEIDTQLHAALAGRGGALLLIGEPGIGKTCTLRELTRRAEADRKSVV